MNAAEISGYIAAGLVFLTFSMKTMIPLRIIGLVSNVAFIAYGYLETLYPVLILHVVLLPLNIWRLGQMLSLTRSIREAAQGDLNMDWLKPIGSTVRARAGDCLFAKGDIADSMFAITSGRFRLAETGIELGAPDVVGEFALFSPERKRTQTLECIEDGSLLKVGYGKVEQLFFQNPQFGFYFLRLIARRLFQNVERLEAELATRQGAVD